MFVHLRKHVSDARIQEEINSFESSYAVDFLHVVPSLFV